MCGLTDLGQLLGPGHQLNEYWWVDELGLEQQRHSDERGQQLHKPGVEGTDKNGCCVAKEVVARRVDKSARWSDQKEPEGVVDGLVEE